MKKLLILISGGVVVVTLAVYLIFFRNSRNEDFINPAFSEYISAFTSGRISVNSNIRIEFTKGVTNVEFNLPVKEKLFSFSPSIDGEAYWIDERTIEFRPSKPMKQGTSYKTKFHLEKIMEVPSDLEEFVYSFETITQGVTIVPIGYQPYAMTSLKWNFAEGKVTTADYADEKLVEEMVTATQQDKKLNLRWTHNNETNEHRFTADSVLREEKASEVLVKWEGSVIDAKGSGSEVVKIPSIYDFFALEAKVEQEPEQYISIRFSDPVDPKQNLEGLIHSASIAGFIYEINGMEIKAYPTARQTGSAAIVVETGIRNIMGAKLKEKHEFQVMFESIKPAVRISGKGVILPGSEGMVLPFEAVNLKAVDVRIIKIFENNIAHFLQVNQLDGQYELRRAGRLVLKKTLRLGGEKPLIYNKWNTFSLDLTKLIEQEPGAIYRVILSFKQSYSTYPCSDDKEGDTDKAQEEMVSFSDRDIEDFAQEEAEWDVPVGYYYYDGDNDYYYEDYNWEERDNPCNPSYFSGSDKSVARNIIASNIGIIAKSNSTNSLTVALADLLTTKPISGAEVKVYNFQNQVIGTGSSDNDGFCTITPKGKPFLIVVKSQKQTGYLRVDDGSALSVSNFDVSGEVLQKGLKGFIYAERGVWRPGDTVYLTFILEDKLNIIPENHPVTLDVINPQGKKVKSLTKTAGENGFYAFAFNTAESDLTGNYEANIKVGSNSFSKTLKIETIKPNRLKINFEFTSEILTAKNQVAHLNVKWLHGAPAKNMKADVSVSLSSITTSFKNYPGYVFDNPTKSFSSDESKVFDGTIDENGNATIGAGITVSESAPGMLRANIVTRVFEPGGEFSIDRVVMPFSPFDSYVGVKCPEGKYRYLDTDTNQVFEIATVDPTGKPVSRQNLEFKLYKMTWRWWWSSDNDIANFASGTYQTPVFSTTISTAGGKGKVSYRLNYPNWGRYIAVVTDKVSGHSSASVVYFDWPTWRGRADREDSKGATMLTFASDKKSYKVGESASITVPTPEKSRMLVSIESGSEILKAWWVDTDPRETKVTFPIDEKMAPNVYVWVSLIQPHAQVKNDMPLRTYGTLPLIVENPEAKLTPVISMPDVIEPEQKTVIKVKEQNGKPMTYTLAIVDDGLLDLTRFKTPDPYTAFNGREALGVKTWDLYDMVMGAFGGKIEQLFAVGGDDEIDKKAGAKAQRFKPVVKFLGPFTLKSGTNSHNVQLPPYIGSVRVMVIAGNKGTFGAADKTVAVRKPLMVLATLPRVVGPGEEVDLPVTVFAMEKTIKRFSVEIVPNEYFTPLDGKSKSMDSKEIGEYNLSFKLKVNSTTGIGKVKVIVTSGSEKSEYDIEIQVRNPNPRITQYVESTIEGSANGTVDYELTGLPGTNKATLEVSSIPALDLSRRLEYLLQYPYGCAEQTTSKSFPQLYIDKFVELSEFDKTRKDEHINYTIKYIGSLMNSEGGIMYWPGMMYADDWVTSYTGHFMIEAEKQGYSLPGGFLKNWVKYQKKMARSWSFNNTYYYNDIAQAYRLYTLALADEPEIGAMNRLKETKNISLQATWRLAAAYVLIGRNDEAKALIGTSIPDIKDYTRFNMTYGSTERDMAMMLETLCLLKDKTAAFPLVKKLSNALSSKYWMSTQSTAYCLLSISKYLEIAQVSNETRFSYNLSGKPVTQVSTKMPVTKITMPNVRGKYSLKLFNGGKGTMFVRVITEGIPETGPETGFENNIKLAVDYRDSDNGAIDVSDLKQGTDFKAIVTVSNIYPGYVLTNLALSQVFPSGWEITNTRFLTDSEAQKGSSEFTYQDFRDDRVNTFFDLSINYSKTFVVKLTAAYTGKFYLPGVLCEAMYEPGVNAFVPGKWVNVVK